MDAGEADPAVDERVDETTRAPLCRRRLLERLADRRQELGVARERLRAVERTLRGHVRPQEPPLGRRTREGEEGEQRGERDPGARDHERLEARCRPPLRDGRTHGLPASINVRRSPPPGGSGVTYTVASPLVTRMRNSEASRASSVAIRSVANDAVMYATGRPRARPGAYSGWKARKPWRFTASGMSDVRTVSRRRAASSAARRRAASRSRSSPSSGWFTRRVRPDGDDRQVPRAGGRALVDAGPARPG